MDASTALGINNARAQTRLIRELRGIRISTGLSIDEVAKAMAVAPEFVIEFERGGMNFSAASLRSYAKAVNAELRLTAKRPQSKSVVSAVTGQRATHKGWVAASRRSEVAAQIQMRSAPSEVEIK